MSGKKLIELKEELFETGYVSFNLKDISLKLLNATKEERNQFEISPANYGIHWPLIDEDLSIKGLINKSSSR